MIVWRGLGFLVVVIYFAIALAINAGVNRWAGNDGYWDAHAWPLAAAFLASGVAVAGLAWLRHHAGEPAHDDLFFLPLKWWPLILAGIGALVLVAGLTPG